MKQLSLLMIMGCSSVLFAMETVIELPTVQENKHKTERVMTEKEALRLLGIKEGSKDTGNIIFTLNQLTPEEFNALFSTAANGKEKLNGTELAFAFRKLVGQQAKSAELLQHRVSSLREQLSNNIFWRNVACAGFSAVAAFTFIGSMIMVGVFNSQS